MRLVDLIYKSEGVWLLELFDNKLFDKNLASELHTYIHTYNLYLCVKSKIAVIQPLTGDTKYYLKI